MLFYDQRKKANSPPVQLNINEVPLNKVCSQRILEIMIDNNLHSIFTLKILQTNVRKYIID